MQREERDLKNKHRNLIDKNSNEVDGVKIQSYLKQLYNFTLKNGYIPVPYNHIYSEIYESNKRSSDIKIILLYLFSSHIINLNLEDFEPEIYDILNDVNGSVYNFNNYFKTFLISINSISLYHDEEPVKIFEDSITFMKDLISNFLENYPERKEEVEKYLVQIKVRYPDVKLLSKLAKKESCDNIFYDNQVLYKIVKDGNLNYCFTKDEYDEYERTGVNPYTSKGFVAKLNSKQNSNRLFLLDKKLIDKLYRWTDQLYMKNRIFFNFSQSEIQELSKTLPRGNITLYRGMNNFKCEETNVVKNEKMVHDPSFIFDDENVFDDIYEEEDVYTQQEIEDAQQIDDSYEQKIEDSYDLDLDNVGRKGRYYLPGDQKCKVEFKTYSSWTYDVKTASDFANGGVILKYTFSRDDVLADLTKIKNRRSQYINQDHESEVIIKPGSYVCEIVMDANSEPEISTCGSKLSHNIKKIKKLFDKYTVENLTAKGFNMEKWYEFLRILGNPKLKGDEAEIMIQLLADQDILIYDETNLRDPQNELACYIIDSIKKLGRFWYQNKDIYNDFTSYYDYFFE